MHCSFPAWLALAATCAKAAYLEQRAVSESPESVPQYFQTTPQIYAGPTPTGQAPFLVKTNPASAGPSQSFVPNAPLETAIPISGNKNNSSIFQLLGQLSPYFPNPEGWGVGEYPLPEGVNISSVHVLHRHGARYPTSGQNVQLFGGRMANATGKFNATGALSFLNKWKYGLGAEVLVPRGRQELFDSGVYFYYQYGKLYNTSTKIIARTTTQDRMLKSAENFMTGFFGLEWVKNATLEPIIELPNFNNSLAGYFRCNNSNLPVNQGGTNATMTWSNIYLADATQRLKKLIPGYNWTVTDSYAAQTLCAYETVAFGFSAFCELFTYEEWKGYEYSIDISFNGGSGFASPVGRAVGIGYVEEILARLNHHVLTRTGTQANITLDNNTTTFPLNQTLNFDFSHDTNIFSILTAFGFKQFREDLPATHIPASRNTMVSRMTPFGARLVIEVITAAKPVPADRGKGCESGGPTTYVHFILNQRTLPLHVSFPECADRVDGWCEIGEFMQAQQGSLPTAKYEFACYGDYPAVPYGTVKNGAP